MLRYHAGAAGARVAMMSDHAIIGTASNKRCPAEYDRRATFGDADPEIPPAVALYTTRF
jgi:hypothetical protein